MDLNIKPFKTKKEVPLPKLNNDILPELNFVLSIVGNMKCGKSTIICNLLTRWYRGVFTNIYFISPTFKSDPCYSLLDIRDENIYDSFNKDIFSEIVGKIDETLEDDPSALSLIVFDDCGGNKEVFNTTFSGQLANLIFLHRHKRLSCIFSVQQLMSLPAGLRRVTPYYIIFKIGTNNEMKIIINENSVSVSKEKLLQMINEATKDAHNFLFINKPNGTFYKNFTERLF